VKTRYFVAAVIIMSILTVAVHFFLHDRYRISYVDDVWSPSHTYTFVTTGRDLDKIFHTESRNISWTFGRTYDFVYGGLAQLFGWSRSGLHVISKLLLLIGAFFWMWIVRSLGFSRVLAVGIFFGLLLIEPVISTANISRKDALAFCLMAIQFYLMVRGRFLEAAFTAGVAFEVHPMGSIMVFFSVMLLWVWRRKWFSPEKRWRTLLLLVAGAVLGVVYFLLLHPHNFAISKFFRAYARSNLFSGFNMQYACNNFLYVYLVHNKHFFQLFFYILVIALFIWKRNWKEEKLPFLFLLILIGASVLLRRPNPHYMIYATPFLLFFAFRTLERHKRWIPMVFLLFILLLGGYTRCYIKHRKFSNSDMSARIRNVVPHDGLPVVASPDFWFAFYKRRFIPTHFQDPWKELKLQKFYFIEDDWAKKYDNWFYSRAVNWCYSNAIVVPVDSTFRIGDFNLRVVQIRKKE